jgi:sulfur-oxidizing protein SoxA
MSRPAIRRRPPLKAILAILLAASAAPAAEIPLDQRRSAYVDMSAANKAMQDDDTSNPAMLSVLDGEALWRAKAGGAGRACADCHGDANASMKGVAARYPAFDAALGRPVNLEQRINLCRARHQRAEPLAYEGKDLLALTVYIGIQSRGAAVAPPDDARMQPFLAAGRAQYSQRQGQLNLACTQCHNDNWGKSLAGNTVSQGHPTGYPIYRLEWQSLGSLQRRLRNCLIGMRAETYPLGAAEYVNMEAYLMWRARGMKLETPAVRP